VVTTAAADHRDALSRRSRVRPFSTGKRVTLTARDLLWLRKLHQHGPMPTSFLQAFASDTHKSEKRAKERLTDLFHEANTAHGGAYLIRPPQQFHTIDSRHNQLVHDIAPAGEAALKGKGLWSERGVIRSGPWLHQFMVSCITASVELATLSRPDLVYIPQHDILTRAETQLRYPTTIKDPATGRSIRKDLIPDALFGLKYRTDDGDRFRFFIVEADRATEPARSSNWRRKSLEGSLLQYREYVGARRYRDHLNLTAPLLVLLVVPSRKQLDRMIALTDAVSGPCGNPYVLFAMCDSFGPVFRPPHPMSELLVAEWQRAGTTTFRIDQP